MTPTIEARTRVLGRAAAVRASIVGVMLLPPVLTVGISCTVTAPPPPPAEPTPPVPAARVLPSGEPAAADEPVEGAPPAPAAAGGAAGDAVDLAGNEALRETAGDAAENAAENGAENRAENAAGDAAAERLEPPAAPARETPPVAGAAPGTATPRARTAAGGSGDMTRTDYSASCGRSGCHAGLSKRPRVHGPVADGCGNCHRPAKAAGSGGGEHVFELVRPVESLCVSCHTRPAAMPVVHRPFAESRCLDCHDPHGGESAGLLKTPGTAALCATCHERHDGPSLHRPYGTGECSLCHAPHQSETPFLLHRPVRQLCVTCHASTAGELAAASFTHGPAVVDCSVCHSPHSADNPLLLRERPQDLCVECHDALAERIAADSHRHGALDTDKGCLECHAPHASGYESLLVGVPKDLCLSCHDRRLHDPRTGETIANIAAVISAPFKHGPIRTGDCQGCHRPHSSSHPYLLRQEYPETFYAEFSVSRYALCFNCHDRSLVLEERTTTLTRFRNGDRNLHYVHVHREKGRTCRACHETHASRLPHHIRESVPFGKRGWPLPINYEMTDTGGACTPGCHRRSAYDTVTPVTNAPHAATGG